MSIVFLANDVGYGASSVGFGAARNVIATGYDLSDMISGPRNRHVRSMQGTGSDTGVFFPRYGCDSAQVTVNYAVLARADKLVNRPLGLLAYWVRYASAGFGGYAYEAGSAITTANLIGIKSQDYVYAYPTARTAYGFGMESYVAGGSSENVGECSKLYFSTGFDFGRNPTLAPRFEDLSGGARLFVPPQAVVDGFAYDTETRFVLEFRNVDKAKITAWRALPNLLRWPIFIYDSAAEVFPHKLEHVLVENWTEFRAGSGTWDISITFRRLAHYD